MGEILGPLSGPVVAHLYCQGSNISSVEVILYNGNSFLAVLVRLGIDVHTAVMYDRLGARSQGGVRVTFRFGQGFGAEVFGPQARIRGLEL